VNVDNMGPVEQQLHDSTVAKQELLKRVSSSAGGAEHRTKACVWWRLQELPWQPLSLLRVHA
jgi:hypothetical protein